ncbi:MAG: PilZ domain-containing protein [Chromatiaceae bacterium]|jgi:hypothetical protein|nr:PilZ domain-containing protein [Chromatiaceae bacterium]
MSVERRYSARYPVDLPVDIRYRKRRFYSARACNLSTDGMYLQVQALTLPTGTLVELELVCEGSGWLVPAVVVHHDASGVGVMFRDPQPELFQALTHPRAQVPPRQRDALRDPLRTL